MINKLKIKLIGKFSKAIFIFIIYISTINISYAVGGLLGDFSTKSGSGTDELIRNGDIHTGDIPVIIKGAIDFFMSLAGTIAIIFVIIGAYKILFGSISQDTTKGKDTIIMALSGFAIAALSWFIIKLIIDNLS